MPLRVRYGVPGAPGSAVAVAASALELTQPVAVAASAVELTQPVVPGTPRRDGAHASQLSQSGVLGSSGAPSEGLQPTQPPSGAHGSATLDAPVGSGGHRGPEAVLRASDTTSPAEGRSPDAGRVSTDVDQLQPLEKAAPVPSGVPEAALAPTNRGGIGSLYAAGVVKSANASQHALSPAPSGATGSDGATSQTVSHPIRSVPGTEVVAAELAAPLSPPSKLQRLDTKAASASESTSESSPQAYVPGRMPGPGSGIGRFRLSGEAVPMEPMRSQGGADSHFIKTDSAYSSDVSIRVRDSLRQSAA